MTVAAPKLPPLDPNACPFADGDAERRERIARMNLAMLQGGRSTDASSGDAHSTSRPPDTSNRQDKGGGK